MGAGAFEMGERNGDNGKLEGAIEIPAISLDDLRQAFADAIRIGATPTPAETNPPTAPSIVGRPDAGASVLPASIIEAILFVGSPDQGGVDSKFLCDVLQGMSLDEIDEEISELNSSYRRCGHPWIIVREGDKYSMQLLNAMDAALDRLTSPTRSTQLSQSAIDCLSLIAYRPGLTKVELDTLWGQNAGATLGYLMKRGLIRCDEEPEAAGHRYYTTDRFLEILGLPSLDDLPQGEEL